MQHLAAEPDIELLGTAANAIEALPLIQRLASPTWCFSTSRCPSSAAWNWWPCWIPCPHRLRHRLRRFTPSRRSRRTPSTTCSSRWSQRASPRRLGDSGRTSPRNRSGTWPRPSAISPATCTNRVRLPIEQVEFAFSDLGGVHVASQGELFHPAHPQVPGGEDSVAALPPPVSHRPDAIFEIRCWTTSWRR